MSFGFSALFHFDLGLRPACRGRLKAVNSASPCRSARLFSELFADTFCAAAVVHCFLNEELPLSSSSEV
jgi:hypothetical protein